MKVSKKNTTTTLIALILILTTITAALAILPVAYATTPPKTWTTVVYLSVSPNPIGVGQQALFIMFNEKYHPTTQNTMGGRFSGYTLEIKRPDGKTDTLGPYTADAIAAAYAYYKPDQIGIYECVFHFPAQIIENTNPPPTWASFNHPDQIGDTYAASTSNTVYLNVTQELVQSYPEAPLPTDYWTRPINGMNRNWYQISEDWLLGAAQPGPYRYSPYMTGPESAHVLWQRPLWEGGIGGGDAGSHAYTGLREEGSGGDPIILNGKLYYADRGTNTGTWGWYAVDLYTGQTLYYANTTVAPSFGQVLTFDSVDAHGAWAYLWTTSGTTWTAIDTFTGRTAFTIANVSSSGTPIYGHDGSILRYNIVGTGANTRLNVWNTTEVTSGGVIGDPGQPARFSGTYDGRRGFSLNVSIPNVQGSIIEVIEGKYVIGGVGGKQNDTAIEKGHIWTLSLEKGKEGTLLSNVTFTPPKGIMDPSELFQYGPYGTFGNTASRMQGPWVYSAEGVFVFWEGATRQLWGFDLATGQMMWGPTEPQDPWMAYGITPAVANGVLYTSGHRSGGEIHAYNITTGESLWKYFPGTLNFETTFSTPPAIINYIADGKVYISSNEHTPTMPLRRDAFVTCLNATTGEVIWKLPQFNGELGSFGMSSGYIVINSIFDGRWYCIGKGPSATTVSAPQTVITQGQSLMITGTVTDQSPGAMGTPAISDADQEAWMAYLYMQQPAPSNAKGVEVSLDTIDPNGNLVHIGTVSSDSSGMFKKMFKPEVPGEYTIIATFAGSKSYGSSKAETAIGVEEAPQATPAQTPASQSLADMYFVPAIAGLFVLIIIVLALVILLILRKRP